MDSPILCRQYDVIIYKGLIRKSVHPFASHWYHCVIKEDDRENMNYINRLQGIKKANRVLRVWQTRDAWVYRDDPDFVEHERQFLLRTRKRCSCLLCGNSRKHYGRTYKEKVADLLMSETE